MGKAAYVLLGLLLATVSGAAQTGAHLYSPGTNLEQSELTQLETATGSVDVAMYSFTDRYLAEELAAVAQKGVRVRVYRDREQFSAGGATGWSDHDRHPAGGRGRGKDKGCKGPYAPEKLCHRRPARQPLCRSANAHRSGFLVSSTGVVVRCTPNGGKGTCL